MCYYQYFTRVLRARHEFYFRISLIMQNQLKLISSKHMYNIRYVMPKFENETNIKNNKLAQNI